MGVLSRKNIVVCYLWWFFLGLFGAHRFYLRKWCTAVIWLLTFGVFTIGWFVDLFLIPGMVESYNYIVEGEKAEVLRRNAAAPPTVDRPAGPVQNVYIHNRSNGGQTAAVQASGGDAPRPQPRPRSSSARARDAGVGGDDITARVVEYPYDDIPQPGYEMRAVTLPGSDL